MMSLGSLFSGIGGFDLGFERAGFETAWQVEIEPFCRQVLEKRFPNAERFKDVRECGAANLRRVDVITGGFPCQDLSVAGKRAGLAGARSGLFWEACRIVGELRPRWLVLENVPGLFSSNGGRDFAAVLAGLGELRCFQSIAWTVLDSRFFGVAQRRRRVFIVCGPRIGSAEAVLFERESRGGNSAPGEEAGKDIAFALAASVRGTGDGHGQGWNSSYAVTGNMRNRSQGPGNYVAATLPADHRTSSTDSWIDNLQSVADPLSCGSGVTGNAPGRRREDDFNLVCGSVRSKWAKGTSGPAGDECDNSVATALRESDGHHGRSSPRGDGCDNLVATLNSGGNDGGFRTEPGEHLVCPTLRGGGDTPGSHRKPSGTDRSPLVCSPVDADGVRDFARLPKGLDSARYRALGNAVTVQVAEWIARRIALAEPMALSSLAPPETFNG